MSERPYWHTHAGPYQGSEDDDLLDGEARVGNRVMTEREWAAQILGEVAGATIWGGFPDISAFDLGRALARSLINCNEPDAYKQMLRGFEHAEAQQ